jgi:hypothetical protein
MREGENQSAKQDENPFNEPRVVHGKFLIIFIHFK